MIKEENKGCKKYLKKINNRKEKNENNKKIVDLIFNNF